MTLIPRLCFGRGDLAVLLQADVGYQDDGTDYDVFFRTDRHAPAGVGGEAAFYTCWLALSVEAATPIVVTCYIDGVALPAQTFNLALLAGQTRTDVQLEVSLLQPFDVAFDPTGTKGLFAPRGCYYQVEIASAWPGAANFVQIEAIELEVEVVQEGKTVGQNP